MRLLCPLAGMSPLGRVSLLESQPDRSFLADKESLMVWEMSFQQDNSSPRCTTRLVARQLKLGNTPLLGKDYRPTLLRGLVLQHSKSHRHSEVVLQFRSHNSGQVDIYLLWPSSSQECSSPE